MDIVYALGGGSRWHNNELKYSLRSLEKHGRNVGNVWIFGNPDYVLDWIDYGRVVYVEVGDTHEYKQRRIMEKIKKACEDHWGISDRFFFMNDDHFMIRDFDTNVYPYYYKNTIIEQIEERRNLTNDHYGKVLHRTNTVLGNLGKTAYNFDVHTPIVYDRKKFVGIMSSFDWDQPFGYAIKSLYSNCAGVTPTRRGDCKINTPEGQQYIWDRIKGLDCFSIGDGALCANLETVLNTLYPNKSKYER